VRDTLLTAVMARVQEYMQTRNPSCPCPMGASHSPMQIISCMLCIIWAFQNPVNDGLVEV